MLQARVKCSYLLSNIDKNLISVVRSIHFIGSQNTPSKMVIINKEKSELRKKIKSILSELTVENQSKQSAIITKKVLDLPELHEANRISIYLSTENEVNTSEILNQLFQLKKEVFVPSYRGNVMEMLKIAGLDDYNSLPLTKWKIKQPTVDGIRENALETGGLDLVLLPGVAFTKNGGRMGHGMGYYDKYLTRLFEAFPEKGREKTKLIGLAFEEQIVQHLPLNDHDVLLDIVLSSD